MTTVLELIPSNWLKTNYKSITWDGTHRVEVALYSRTPQFSTEAADVFASIGSFDNMSSYPEWVSVGATLTGKQTLTGFASNFYLKKISINDTLEGLQVVNSTGVAMSVEDGAGWYFDTNPTQVVASAAVFYLVGTVGGVVNPILFATTQGFGSNTVAHYQSLYGQYETGVVLDKQSIVIASTNTVSITNKALASNVATLTTLIAHGFQTGQQVVVTGVDSTFNGTYTITGTPTTTTFRYAKTYAGTIASTAVTPNGSAYINGSTTFSIGETLLSLSTPIWEGAHAQHVWLQPQRTNFIANPSFETTGGAYWRAGRATTGAATITSTAGGITSTDPVRQYAGRLQTSGTGSGNIILESNFFPKVNDWYSVSFYASGNGSTVETSKLYFGIVIRPPDSVSTTYVRNRTEEVLGGGTATSGFKKFTALIQIPDDVSDLMLRIEYSGTTLWVDNVLVDPHEGQYEYFDGNSKDGLNGDFRWMGGSSPTYINKHFSLWYSNYENTRGRLLGDYSTLDNLYKPGLLEEWSPTGSNITAHWDAVTNVTPLNWEGDAFYPISNVNGSPVSTIGTSIDFNLGSI